MKLGVVSLIFFAVFVCLIKAKPIKERLELVEGDMLLTKEQKEEFKQLKAGRVRRAAVLDNRLWPNGTVYYTLNHPSLTQAGKNLARDAMEDWMNKTCLKFIERTNQTAYVEFQMDGKCRAMVGYRNTANRLISLGSARRPCSLGSSIHEIGHGIGFYHEHTRPDRDDFVTVNETNMIPRAAHNYLKKTEDEVDSRGKDYDYGSIMHYSRTQASINGNDVLIPINPRDARIGQRDGLSEGDIAQAKDMYKCDEQNDSHLYHDASEDKSGSGGPDEILE